MNRLSFEIEFDGRVRDWDRIVGLQFVNFALRHVYGVAGAASLEYALESASLDEDRLRGRATLMVPSSGPRGRHCVEQLRAAVCSVGAFQGHQCRVVTDAPPS